MIYFLMANGFEEAEAVVPFDLLKRAELDVRFVSAEKTLTVTGAHDVKIVCDISLEDMNLNEMRMLVLPGGGKGVENLDNLSSLTEILEYSANKGLFIAAICAAPSLLGKRGLLEGKKAVCYPGFEKFLTGAEIQNSRVVKDGNIITAKGAGAAFEFGLQLVSVLKSEETAERIKDSIY